MKKISILLAAIAISLTAMADEFDSVVDRIVMSDPAFRAELQRITADSLAMRTENNLQDPEISVESLFGKGDNKYNIGLTQSFDWPALYKARRERNDLAGAAATARLAATQADRRVEVATLLLDIIASNKKIENYCHILERMQRLLDVYKREYAKGNVTVLDVNKLRIEEADYEQMLDDERQTLADAHAKLAAMTKDMDVAALTASLTDYPIRTLASLEAYREAMNANSAELQAIKAERLLGEYDVKVAALGSKPGFSVGYRYSYEDAQSYNGFALGMSLPLWSGKGKKEAAQASVLATELEEAALANTLNANLEADYATAQSLKSRIAKYGEALTTTDNIGILNRAFEAGQINLTNYITDMRYFVEAEIRMYELQHDYAAAVMALERYK